MADDDKVPFLILATRQSSAPFTALFFVRAKTLADAYVQVLQEENGLCQHPDLRLQGHVFSAGMAGSALQLKGLAEFYWNMGRQAEANPNHDPTFEEAWEEHGADPDDS